MGSACSRVAVAALLACALCGGCASPPVSPAADPMEGDFVEGVIAGILDAGRAKAGSGEGAKTPRRVYVPLSWDASSAFLVGRQGSTHLWGTCGQCVIANTLNLVCKTSYTEADVVDYVSARGLCDPSTGGMTVNDMIEAYEGLLPLDDMDVYWYCDEDALTIDEMAAKLERGIVLNVSVYGEMMREGGHVGEGEVYGTHWLVLSGVDRVADGSVAGFHIIDSASDIAYLSAQELSDVYHGHDGTTIIDPACLQVYGWRYGD